MGPRAGEGQSPSWRNRKPRSGVQKVPPDKIQVEGKEVEETLDASQRSPSSAMSVVRAAISQGNVRRASREAELENRPRTWLVVILGAKVEDGSGPSEGI